MRRRKRCLRQVNNLNKVILPGQTIGIIGGGQLGRMMALAAKASGFKIAVLDPTPDCPCGQVADIEITANYDDLDALQQLARVSDVITFEFENINGEALDTLLNNAYVPQGSELLKISQNRIIEKRTITESGAKVAPYAVIKTKDDLTEQVGIIGFPCVLKTATGGYDGKGQHVLKSKEDVAEAVKLLGQSDCVLETWINFSKEISVIVARNVDGETKVFPVAENIHHDNILHQSIVPARITEETEQLANKQAILIANSMNMVGILAVEMFVTEDGDIYINELAPRPHNSGHYTMEACETSQFEQHIRAVCNWKLGDTTLLKPVVMVNILGEHMDALMENIPKLDNWKIHLYGKSEAKLKRKMGHVNILRDNTDLALKEAEQSKIWS
ncbi:5-(carboxyamino)imidazole ribonucleotide synthase [Bacillus sp. AGMB 02131]|uniref:N5-carboxyaminoimidazole ribonucleotide synthase n=1 Tax=Peribacillus faecalis TaxID=2772559 RepID=A0A927CY80_9BACI|nr:5-(carboxyamino)imidazole ribonucleotide synthase [Peribacillus faecalis]